MPRQPYLKCASHKVETEISIGPDAIGQRPEIETLIGYALTTWPHVEAEMALFLGESIGTENAATLAVFQALRRSSSQREAISAATNVLLDDQGKELVSAILTVHKAIEADRNALAHGHFGASSAVNDGILWVDTNEYIKMRLFFALNPTPHWDEPLKREYLSNVWVYKAKDVEKILSNIQELGSIWFNGIDYLSLEPGSALRAEKYQLLSNRPHIAEALKHIRQKNTP